MQSRPLGWFRGGQPDNEIHPEPEPNPDGHSPALLECGCGKTRMVSKDKIVWSETLWVKRRCGGLPERGWPAAIYTRLTGCKVWVMLNHVLVCP